MPAPGRLDFNGNSAVYPVYWLAMELGALFDWDGVIIDSSDHHEESWEMLASELDKPLPPDHFLRGFGMKNQVISDLYAFVPSLRVISTLDETVISEPTPPDSRFAA